jgi:carbonic anhydrase/acetyltransferase-like protein (isoleucine patch superfamily)
MSIFSTTLVGVGAGVLVGPGVLVGTGVLVDNGGLVGTGAVVGGTGVAAGPQAENSRAAITSTNSMFLVIFSSPFSLEFDDCIQIMGTIWI